MEENNICKSNAKAIYDSFNNRFLKKYGLDSLLEYFTNEEKIKIINDRTFNQILKPQNGCAYFAIVDTKHNVFDIVYCLGSYVMGNVKDTRDLIDLTKNNYDKTSIVIADITEIAELKAKSKKNNSSTDMVNHPSHYNYGDIEVIDYINQVTNGYKKGHVAYCIGNVVKYVSRAPFKNGLEDLKKAKWYLDEAIKKYEN